MCACKAPKDVIYFQGIDDLTPDELAEMSQAYTIKIENDDLLSINVTAWDPVAVTPFNPPVFAYSSQGEQPLIASESMYTYLVDEDGCINFPIIGKVHVAGLTRQEISKKLESKISKYVKDPLVNVQLLNFMRKGILYATDSQLEQNSNLLHSTYGRIFASWFIFGKKR